MNELKFKQKIDALKFNDNGLIPCVAQDHESKQVLMLAWGSRDTLFQSVSSGLATYWSRSRGEVWVKGKTSGNIQEIKKIHIDCDGDTVLFEVKQTGAACHTGSKSVSLQNFFRDSFGTLTNCENLILQLTYKLHIFLACFSFL